MFNALYSCCSAKMSKPSSYAERLQEKAKTRYLEKLKLWVDPFVWPTVERERIIRCLLICNVFQQLIEAADLVAYLVLQTNLLLHSSLRPINLWKPIINSLVAGSRMSDNQSEISCNRKSKFL